MEERKDIFDRIMELPGLNYFEPFYKKYKSILLYLFWGGIAFFLNLFLFIFIDRFTPINELVNNAICWIICVIFQFITNKTMVFNSHPATMREAVKQFLSFTAGRVFTLVLEEAILGVFITWLGFNEIVVKLSAQVVVIVLNYVISKLFVFRDKNES